MTSLLTRPTLTQLNNLSREKDQQLTTKNTQIASLTSHKTEWEKQKKDFELWLRAIIKPFSDERREDMRRHVDLHDIISDNLDLNFPFSYGTPPFY